MSNHCLFSLCEYAVRASLSAAFSSSRFWLQALSCTRDALLSAYASWLQDEAREQAGDGSQDGEEPVKDAEFELHDLMRDAVQERAER